ncbi:MAG: hypothetical protein EG822_06680 [Deltaproteobacteria bacterium]|nr:hypothetical protein [Deltaproteobacteria bacterium]TLN01500.1 MAG: hypothetical protein FDZ73_15590 [bacterium]
MVNHVNKIRKRKKYKTHKILPLVGDDLRKFKEYYPDSFHVHVIVCFYSHMLVVIPCDSDGKSEWDGGGLIEMGWRDVDYEKTIEELKKGTLINW